MITDLRYALRMLAKNLSFTLVAVLTIALGVGANTALFSVVDAVLLKKLPVKDPDQLVLFNASWDPEKFGPGGFNGSNPYDPDLGLTVGTSFPVETLRRLHQEHSVLSDVFAFSPMALNFNASGEAEVVSGQVVSGNYYTALGVTAILGRTITDVDDNLGVTPVAVLSHRFWSSRFGSDPSVVGKQVNINNVAFTIAGVTPAGFSGTGNVGSSPDVSIPLAWEPQVAGEQTNMRDAGIWWLRLMGRLQPGTTLEQAHATLAGPFQQSVVEHRAMRQARSKTTLGTINPKDLPRLGVDSGSQGEMDARNGFAVPLMLRFGPGNPGEIEIVGLARDAKYRSQRAEIEPTVFQPWQQSLSTMRNATFEVRTAGEPASYIAGIRQAMREVDSNLPLSNIRTQIQQANQTLAMERVFAKLLTLFGLIAQQLAAIGLYGVMAFAVSQRTHEIGIRMALGANRGNVLAMILRQGMSLTLIGVAAGLAAAYVLMNYLQSLTDLLFGVEATDVWTFAAIGALLVVVALVACLVPARRATKVDPLIALRYE
ncbi:MAG TPA: ABC transporter permease [Pyrinomonadaceae bacterium]|nr:ABC transporter permease [Pyrinomonadaceae bacterium]